MATGPIPFLAALKAEQGVRSLAAVLPPTTTGAPSKTGGSWIAPPQAVAARGPSESERAAAAAAAKAELDAAKAAAIEEGRAEGLAQLAAQGERLAKIIEQAERRELIERETIARAIAEAATSAIEAWVGAAPRADVFGPAIRGWLGPRPGDEAAECGGAVRVHPTEVAAIAALVEATPALTVCADAAVRPGDIAIADAERELVVNWKTRLNELRDAIVTALATARDVQSP